MTPEEKEILVMLAAAYNEFVKLPILHSHDQAEFVQAIHAAQNIVLARAGLRAEREQGVEVA